MKIVVLAGGFSPERDVSLVSGSLIANALREAGHHVVLVDVYEGISENIDYKVLFLDNTAKPYTYAVPEAEPDLEDLKRRNGNRRSLIGPNVLEICREADSVFIALHGAMGENGQLQAIFDVTGIPYTGTGYIGSLLAMDKDISKKLLRHAGIPTADWIVVSGETPIEIIVERVGLPCVVKPMSAGSSIGVSIVNSPDDLKSALKMANKVDENILIEKMIAGREFSVGILGGIALPVIEIIPKQGFYDYKNKYQAGLTEEVCPANLSAADTKRVQKSALMAHSVLRLGTYSRIDFILSESGEFICLEANTLPGMTPTSLLPQEALANGMSYVDLCNRIVQLSAESNKDF